MSSPQLVTNSSAQISDRWWSALLRRDKRHDGIFFYGVVTTGIFCRPSCSSRRPRRRNVVFFGAPADAQKLGFRPCLRCRPLLTISPQAELLRRVCRYLEENIEEPVKLRQLAAQFSQSPFHLQRTFKAALGVTPREYADACRITRFKRDLQAGHSVTRAMVDAGYSSTSRLYERTAAQLGMNPDRYRRGAVAVPIHYTTVASPLGRMLVAATQQGVCSIQFGAHDEELETGLRREYPFALRKRDDEELRRYVTALIAQLKGAAPDPQLPLDIRATAFQRMVWNYLRTIPAGETRSYAQVAKAIGHPTATRAVARACASNPVAIAVPCHRVVRTGGELGGYRWGLERKQALLDLEGGPH